MKYLIPTLLATLLALSFTMLTSSCQKDCDKSDEDCSLILYTCDTEVEVCGCDGVTYACALDAECRGQIADYTSGPCK